MPSVAAKRGRNVSPEPRRWAAWLVHMYTGSGAVLAFAGAWAVVHGYDRIALGSMLIATIVDSTDGARSRAA
jgi:phosphatidylserine synthase